MNLLPYVKFTSDPIIYGLRMREVKVGFRALVQRSRQGHFDLALTFLVATCVDRCRCALV